MEEHLQVEPARSSPLKQTCGHWPCGAEAVRGGLKGDSPDRSPRTGTAGPGCGTGPSALPLPRDGARVVDVGESSE